MIDQARIDNAIILDEIGIATAVFGSFRLKSVFQPIFTADASALTPWGVEARLRPLREGLPVAPTVLAETLTAAEVPFFEALCRALHIDNHPNIGVDGMSLFCSIDARHALDPARILSELDLLSAKVAEVGMDPQLLVCSIAETEKLERSVLVRLATAIRLHGFSLGVDDFAAGFPSLEQVACVEPNIVKVDGPWFRRVTSVPRASKLLGPLFAGFRQSGANVLVDGIETVDQLNAAIDADAMLVQGPLLAAPALAGALFPTEPIERASLGTPQGNVVRLSDRRRIDQQR
ncbi:EAL domain-containing protein [Tianweitania sp. BSSL-BM11]|uniref:EAL domain-containing protein n=1 Tax=Tianweitania aestuarii TaxID=2814886 RepID=A0ABS5RVC8_9HYPH|nr:EAL domain-containing protein [Tianweitania aestuarii]MBS9721003.1 EAL domain-containing protein [Tianweitania aestuarii]